jgi:hypothetical protein
MAAFIFYGFSRKKISWFPDELVGPTGFERALQGGYPAGIFHHQG